MQQPARTRFAVVIVAITAVLLGVAFLLLQVSSPHIRILVVTLFEDDASIFTALRAGARGYILKDTKEEEMLLFSVSYR